MQQEAKQKDIWDKLGTIDYRYIYVTFIILMFIPILSPLGIPMKVGPTTQAYYNTINDLPKGAAILFHNWVSLDIWSDNGPVLIVTGKVLWRIPQDKDITIIMYQSSSDAAIKMKDLLVADLKPPQWRLDTYGKTWVNFGYQLVYYSELTFGATAADMTSTCKADIYNTPTMNIEACKKVAAKAPPYDVLNAYDFDLFVFGSWGCTDPDVVVRQWWTGGAPPYRLPILFMTIGNCVPNAMPYYGPTNAIKAFIPGAAGAAELELLTGLKGEGTKMADITDLGGIGTLIFFAIGNVAFFGKRFFGKKEVT